VYDEDTLQVTIAPPLNDGGANITHYNITTACEGIQYNIIAQDNVYTTILQSKTAGTNYGDWTKLTSRGLTYGTSDVGQALFDTTFSTSPTRILRRVCRACGLEHKDIYYKRLTVIPSSISMYDLLHGTWLSSSNTLGIDFSLHSTYKDAVGNKNAWSFCNYNDNGIGKSTMGGVVSCRVVFFAVPVAHFYSMSDCLCLPLVRISKGLWPLNSD
jgi:hypothetical protein